MVSTYCYMCEQYAVLGNERIIFVKCTECTDCFLTSQQVFDKITAIIIENNNNVCFKDFEIISVHKHQNMNKNVTDLIKKPTRTVLKTMLHDLVTVGGTNIYSKY